MEEDREIQNSPLILFILGFYCALLLRSLNESRRRSLELRDDIDATDHVVISVLVTGVNPAAHELTGQISLQPRGALARDEVTPAVDLKLLTNNVRSQQEFDFPQGKRMNRIEAVFPLNGELNKYPFDRYVTTLWLLITTPTRKVQPQTSSVPEGTENEGPQGDHLLVGTTALQQSTVVPLTITLSASTPGIKFKGNVSRESSLKVTGYRTGNEAGRQCDRCFHPCDDVDDRAGHESAGHGVQGRDNRSKSRSGSALYLNLTDFRLASSSKRPTRCPAGGSIWGLCLLHLGGTYRGGVGHHHRMDVASALTGRAKMSYKEGAGPYLGNATLRQSRVVGGDRCMFFAVASRSGSGS